jgi:Cutinase
MGASVAVIRITETSDIVSVQHRKRLEYKGIGECFSPNFFFIGVSFHLYIKFHFRGTSIHSLLLYSIRRSLKHLQYLKPGIPRPTFAIMKFILSSLVLSSLAFAAPIEDAPLEKRLGVGTTSNAVKTGACKPVTLIFARGTWEGGNMGSVVGPELANALSAKYPGGVAVQGVDYGAGMTTNFELGDPKGVATMAALANQAATKCPNTKIALSGYR